MFSSLARRFDLLMKETELAKTSPSIRDIRHQIKLFYTQMILTRSKIGLQNCLETLSSYCRSWMLNINPKKTKVMVFQRRARKNADYKFVKIKNIFGSHIIVINRSDFRFHGVYFA